jgi:integrase
VINWKILSRGLARGRQAANDRAPTVEEFKKLIEYPDRRISAIVCVMVSSGIRLGAWDSLKWKHVVPIENNDGAPLFARLFVYPGDKEEYYKFISWEALIALNEWKSFFFFKQEFAACPFYLRIVAPVSRRALIKNS